MIPIALTIAGSDPSGGAGIQADLKAFHQHGVYGEAVITLLTVQNTRSVDRVHILDPDLVTDQIRAVVTDIPPAAAKTGALGNALIIRAVAMEAASFSFPLIVDPVMISKHGTRLMAEDAKGALLDNLLPYAALITPNLPEAEELTGIAVDDLRSMRKAAEILLRRGAGAVLIKGGHLKEQALDLYADRNETLELPAERIPTAHTHGTGCTYSAAITAQTALGLPMADAVRAAKAYITDAIRTNPRLGSGRGPVNHFARVP